MKNILFVAIGLLISTGIGAQINVTHVEDGTKLNDKQGLFYALPRTLIVVDIQVKKTEYIAGPYAEYASRYLDLKDVNTSDYNEYEIIDMKVSSLGIPDPSQVYFAEITEKADKADKAVLMALSESGMAVDMQGNTPNNIMTKMAGFSIDDKRTHEELFKYYAETNLFQKFDTIIQKVVVDTVTVEKKYLESSWLEKSDEDKALDAANRISRIREARYNTLTGYQEIAYEADALAYMDQQLVKMEGEYLSLFTGVMFQKTLTYSIIVDPMRTDAGTAIPVFVFSERSGVKDVNAPGGEKVMMHVEMLGDFGTLRSITSQRNTSTGEHGFYYRIPVVAKVKLTISNDVNAEGVFSIAQFGTVSYLPPDVTSVQFHPQTGAVKLMLLD